MNLWLRLLRVFIAALFRPRLALTDESVLGFRVMPHDLDINIHMNNARYFALMDLGRLDLIIRGGLWRPVLKNRWQPVIGAALVRFRRPLKPFQPLTLGSRLLGWDEKWLYIEHRIESNGALSCHTIVRGAFVGAGGVVAPAAITRAMGHDEPSPPLPDWIVSWRDLDTAIEACPALNPELESVPCVP